MRENCTYGLTRGQEGVLSLPTYSTDLRVKKIDTQPTAGLIRGTKIFGKLYRSSYWSRNDLRSF